MIMKSNRGVPSKLCQWILSFVLIHVCCMLPVFGQLNSNKIPEHPRLFLLKGEEKKIKEQILLDITWTNLHKAILSECDAICMDQPLQRTLIGRRLLQVSREGLRRVFFLAYAWRLTGKKKYFKRCEEELLNASKFTDWNPDHFLDVAEMTTALAIGYDWLYNDLSGSSKQIISKAILEKGIKPSLNDKFNGWLRGSNNWNQVCNAGATLGALSVFEDQPAICLSVIDRALKSILKPMTQYAPDGNYPEGYSYWGYGTSFNVLLINALERVFGSDFGLTNQPGFLQSATFYQNLIGNSGQPFNYSDCGGTEGLQPVMFWFANKMNDPGVLYREKDYLLSSKFNQKTNRLLPAAMIWASKAQINKVGNPDQNTWFGKGGNEIAVMRTGWETNDMYIGFKAGSPSHSHGHMDAGSFVFDALGVRWSADLGMQQYNSLESAGLDIWKMSQESQRWQVFRYSNFSHSTLVVNNRLQQVNGRAPILKTSSDPVFTSAVMDLTSLYKQDLRKAQRGIAIVNKSYVTIRDEVETGDSSCMIRWAMLTPAKIESIHSNQAMLTSNGQRLIMYVTGVTGVNLRIYRTDPPHSYDALNTGTSMIGFEIIIPANTKKDFDVILVPGDKPVSIKRSAIRPLETW